VDFPSTWRAGRGRRLRHVCRRAAALLTALFVAYVAFVLLWGLNYARQPFAEIAGLEVRPAPVEEPAALCVALIDRANGLRLEVGEAPDGVMTRPRASLKGSDGCILRLTRTNGRMQVDGTVLALRETSRPGRPRAAPAAATPLL